MKTPEERRQGVREALSKRRARLRLERKCVDCGLPKDDRSRSPLCSQCREDRRLRQQRAKLKKAEAA